MTRDEVMAYRVRVHELHRVDSKPSELRILDLGVQDGGSDSCRVALAARTTGGLDEPGLELGWALRGAPHLLRRADLAAFARAAWPLSDADAGARIASNQLKDAAKLGLSAFELAATAMREIVTAPMPRSEVSTLISARMPPELVFDCAACRARHISGALFQQVGIFAGVRVEPRRQGSVLSPIEGRHPGPEQSEGTAELLTAYLRLNGPATLADAARYVGTRQTVLRSAWPEGLAEVDVDGRRAFLPADELPALAEAPGFDGLRLLPPMDPLLQGRDRDVLVPDAAVRSELWKALGNPGAVLRGIDVVGTWRPRLVARKRLELRVTLYAKLTRAQLAALDDEANRMAATREVAEASVTVTP